MNNQILFSAQNLKLTTNVTAHSKSSLNHSLINILK